MFSNACKTLITLSPGFIHSFIPSFNHHSLCFCKVLKVAHDLPQRSVLGPLLFLILVNDLNTGKNNALLYADDQSLLPLKVTLSVSHCCKNTNLKWAVSTLQATFSTTWSIHCVAYCQYILISVLHLKTNSQLSELARDKVHSHNTRGSNNLNILQCRLSKVKDSYPVLAYKVYNKLRLECRRLEQE